MKNSKQKLAAFITVMLLTGSTVFGQVTATATATATIIEPIAISKTVDMNFGNIAINTNLGTVVLATDNSRTKTGGVTLPVSAGTVTAAQFDVTGEANSTYSITMGGAITISFGANPDMTVDTWVTDPTPTGTLDGSGAQTILVGATLHVAGSQPAGTYVSATPFSITVNYN